MIAKIKEIIKNIWGSELSQKVRANWQAIITWGLPLLLMLVIVSYVWKYALNRRICVRCQRNRPTHMFWLKITSDLGICYQCIAKNIWGNPEPAKKK